ncbi:glycosyltransferase family 4 protein [Spirochaeta isovalerica]|uniref:Glycosyltransferase involved in cell wall biosynthesis n=1 Tax=Spirochaeta isovalerica TaxID=150 RepID=A0A841R7A3_9SPIO|nr:glycosyltransferase family 4 protein [Spirochaeta isovalerica]MBB6479261.1 glycosyltransferase involved in cell wall biosynthesis [Spirochaeta isovalerica]
MHKTKRIKAFYPNFFRDKLISYVVIRLVYFFRNEIVESDVMGYCSKKGFDKEIYEKLTVNDFVGTRSKSKVYYNAIPPGITWSIIQKIFSIKQIRSFSEWCFFMSLQKGDIVYLWPNASLKLYYKLKTSGFIIVSERINTLLQTSHQILNKEYNRLGITPQEPFSTEEIAEELECMNLSDYIFSPSPSVTESILRVGISQSKILQVSYGLEEDEIIYNENYKSSKTTITALFVGTICLRKGVHLLLSSWEKANVNARLIFIGNISHEIANLFSTSIKNLHNIEHIGFVDDLNPYYKGADFMILPSLEEGSPLVTYLALGAGLPSIVSPMGSGGIIQDDVEGFVIDPFNENEFVSAIQMMVNNSEIRNKMAQNSVNKAKDYVWEKVAYRRRELLFSKLSNLHKDPNLKKEN